MELSMYWWAALTAVHVERVICSQYKRTNVIQMQNLKMKGSLAAAPLCLQGDLLGGAAALESNGDKQTH